MIVKLVEDLRGVLEEHSLAVARAPYRRRAASEEHRGIYDAIVDRDPTARRPRWTRTSPPPSELRRTRGAEKDEESEVEMKIRTVTGDVPPRRPGRTLTHEHLLYTYPGGEYDHLSSFKLDDAVEPDLARAEGRHGPVRLRDDRRHDAVRSRPPSGADEARRRETGCNVIGVTGFFPERMGVPYWFRRQTVDELAEFYVRDITEGMVFGGSRPTSRPARSRSRPAQESVDPKPSPDRPQRPRIGVYEDRLIRAAGRAQKRLGVCINTHTDPMDYTVTNPGIEQLDMIEEEGGDPSQGDHRPRVRRRRRASGRSSISASAAPTCRSIIWASRGGTTTPRSSTRRWRA